MLKLSFSLEIVLLSITSGIGVLAPLYDTHIVRKSIIIPYNFNESFLPLASMQSDQGLFCPLTESLDITECINEKQRPGYFAQYDLNLHILCTFE